MSAWFAFTALGFYPVAPGSNEYVIGRPFLDGKPLARSFLRHEDLSAGGELVFTMQATPSKDWGKERTARPYTQTAYGQ